MTNSDTKIDVGAYAVTDGFFGAPYIDVDEQRDVPVPHRFVHGGFEGTDTRFAFSFPDADGYDGRMFQPLEGANAGHEDAFATTHGAMLGGLEMIARQGGYMVESNMGHIGDVQDPKAGDDLTIYGWRAAAETGRFSKYVATQIYGEPPHHAYVWGGSGGARRSPQCLERAPDVWDAAMPFMGDANVDDGGAIHPIEGAAAHFAAMFNVQRLLGDRILELVDAMAPGGSGDPFTGFDTHVREEIANLYRLGYPRGDEWVISQPTGTIWLWCSMADRLLNEDAEYFANFWTQPGHVGHDQPEAVLPDLLQETVTVKRALTPRDFVELPEFQTPEHEGMRGRALMMAASRGLDFPLAIEIEGISKHPGYLQGAGVKLASGVAAGRSLYVMFHQGDILVCDGLGENSNDRFEGVLPGDSVEIDNRAFLAWCYYYRHHLLPFEEWEFLKVDGKPIYPQYALPAMSPFMAAPYSCNYQGKLMWIHHTHDASLWPPQGIGYANGVARIQGEQAAADRFRLRWTENAEHVPGDFVGPQPGRATNTWLIDYRPVIDQCLADVVAWVEEDVDPDPTAYAYADGKITLPPTAAERGGIQPVVVATADGEARAHVKVGEPVRLGVHAEVPAGSGTLIAARWDFDGSGRYPMQHGEVDGSATSINLSVEHTYDAPGTYFATVLVESHRAGDVHATNRRIPNIASARIIVE
jgi:hypothetical protein